MLIKWIPCISTLMQQNAAKIVRSSMLSENYTQLTSTFRAIDLLFLALRIILLLPIHFDMSQAELANSYAALILADDEVAVTVSTSLPRQLYMADSRKGGQAPKPHQSSKR